MKTLPCVACGSRNVEYQWFIRCLYWRCLACGVRWRDYNASEALLRRLDVLLTLEDFRKAAKLAGTTEQNWRKPESDRARCATNGG